MSKAALEVKVLCIQLLDITELIFSSKAVAAFHRKFCQFNPAATLIPSLRK